METEKKNELFLVSEHPDLFGPLSQAFQSVNRDKLIKKSKFAMNCLLVFLFLLAIPVGYRIYVEYQASQAAGFLNSQVWLDTLKIIALYICIAASLAMLGVGLYYFRIKHLLLEMEESAELGRDMARVMFPYYRQELQEIKMKIKSATQPQEGTMTDFATIVKSLLPVAQMILKKDANVISWGMQGYKLYKNLTGFFKK